MKKHNSVGCKGDYSTNRVASTRHLKRILTYLSSINQFVRINEIKDNTGLGINHIKDALSFLTGYNLILIAKNNSVNYYFINPIFKKSKEKISLQIKKRNNTFPLPKGRGIQ